jgi:trans-aconitate methyltransferase
MSDSASIIARLFDAGAASYDAVRRKLVPCFDAFYASALDIIGEWAAGAASPPALLDLGAGTGLFSAMVAERLAGAKLHLVDAAEAMLAEARQRFASTPHNVSFAVRDYAEGSLGGPWDIVISALSIHHLADDAKRRLFARVFDALRPGGLFVNADQVLGPTPVAEARYRRLWDKAVLASGVDRREYERAVERMRYDRCAPLDAQLDWMRAAGFREVDCAFKHWRFAVYFGFRPEARRA